MGFLAGKRILITGLLSKHSIAYGIAKACHREGATLAFTYQNERFLDRITKFATEFDSSLVFACDVADDAQIDKLFADLAMEARLEAEQAGRPRLPIVALTAGAFASERVRCSEAGMDDFLAKPIDREQLSAVLQRWLGGTA